MPGRRRLSPDFGVPDLDPYPVLLRGIEPPLDGFSTRSLYRWSTAAKHALGETRTRNRPLRRRQLYPIENYESDMSPAGFEPT